MAADGYTHTIVLGDTTSGLAIANGLLPTTVWDHPQNQKLKQTRADKNILHPGDQLYIPALRERDINRPVDQRHRFVRKGTPEMFRMRLLDYDNTPLANEPYQIKIDNQVFKTGTLDGEGWVKTYLPPGTRAAELGIGEEYSAIVLQLDLGYLNPLAEISGLQARLRNVGYFDGSEDGQDSPEFRDAVRRFRKDRGLAEGDQTDSEFREALKKAHLS